MQCCRNYSMQTKSGSGNHRLPNVKYWVGHIRYNYIPGSGTGATSIGNRRALYRRSYMNPTKCSEYEMYGISSSSNTTQPSRYFNPKSEAGAAKGYQQSLLNASPFNATCGASSKVCLHGDSSIRLWYL